MITFLTGIVILIVGGAVYGKFCEKVLKPTNENTPAIELNDGVDFVPLSKWRATLVELLNIAGTGPVLGPIQGILFGPVAFITIPVGCVLGGAFHDYMCGMISVRNKGEQMPALVKRFLGQNTYFFYNIFVCLLLILLGTVFIYTPGDLFVSQILKSDVSGLNSTLLIVYAVIFTYYLAATLFPIDKIIGKIYPIFGAVLLLSAVGIFFGLFIHGYPLNEILEKPLFTSHPFGENFIPIFFVTVTCGIVSGFHSTQATIISRTVENEHDGRTVFYNSMIAEGFIAMTWAAGTMGVLNLGISSPEDVVKAAVLIVGAVAKDLLGDIGGIVAVISVIILGITSGDTALRSLRLIIGENLKIDQRKKKNILTLSVIIFASVAVVLFYAKTDGQGFAILWRYFAWANETIVVFAFAMISIYMMKKSMPYLMALIPGTFYMHVISSYILHAKIGLGLEWNVSYILAGILSAIYMGLIIKFGKKQKGMIVKQ